MIRRATLTILLGAATAFAQEIPDRPEKLQFAPIRFETPRQGHESLANRRIAEQNGLIRIFRRGDRRERNAVRDRPFPHAGPGKTVPSPKTCCA